MLSYGLMAGLLALIVDGIYLWLIRTQGNVDEPWRVVFVAVVIATFAIAVIVATARATGRWAVAITGFAAVGLLTVAVLAGFSIGILILPSLAGFTLVTYAPPGCPEGGHHIEGTISEGGHVTSFICENGHLVSWSRR